MATRITIEPITRISGPLSIEVEIEKNKIIDVKSRGVLFRGFESMLEGRPPLDAVYFTERICGICSTAHGVVASLALEDALKVKPDENGVRIRDFAHGADFIQNIIRQICLFVFPDYVKIKEVPGSIDYDFRLPDKLTQKISEDYLKALEYSRFAHEMVAIIGGKAPHNHGVFVGGTTANLDASKIIRLKYLLQQIYEFICTDMIEDINIISAYYPEYFKIGAGTKNLLTFGLFNDLPEKELVYAYPSVCIDDKKSSLDVDAIKEGVEYSWYKNTKSNTVPSEEPSELDIKKPGAYTFVKAPRYKGKVVQVGPLARMVLSNNYKYSISTMDRLIARVLEGKLLSERMLKLLDFITPTNAVQNQYIIPESAEGKGLYDAVRGALGHWIKIENGVIKNYDIITPTVWNLSPKDSMSQHGAIEESLIGTEIENVKSPVEIGRIIRSFDPCISCATHVTTDCCKDYNIEIL